MSKYLINLFGFCGASGHKSNTRKPSIGNTFNKPVGYVNPHVLEKFKRGSLTICFIHPTPFNTEYPGKSVAAVPVYDNPHHAVAETTRTSQVQKIRQGYEEGKASMRPEIKLLKAEIVELKRQLSEQSYGNGAT